MLSYFIENDVFLHLLNLSISASFLVLAVLVLRLLLKKAPKWISCLLWGLAGLRLVFPFSIESIFSLIPSAETVSPDILYEAEPTINSGIPAVDALVNPILTENFAHSYQIGVSVNPLQIVFAIATLVWFCGLIAMVLYMLVGYIRLRLRLRTAVKIEDNIYLSENMFSPFIFGTLRPRIYLPFSMDKTEMTYVLAHEKAHLHRFDHLTKPLAYLILSVYWFNPLLWVAYILFCRDIELACDEKAVREMDAEEKKAYSYALLSCSMNKKNRLACPLAFGEISVKERVKNVINYKKPAFWLVILAVIAVAITAVCFLTMPKEPEKYGGGFGESQSSAVSHYYAADALIGDHIAYSFVQTAEMCPYYYTDEDMRLFERKSGEREEHTWNLVGQLKQLTKEEISDKIACFDEGFMLFRDETGTGGISKLFLKNLEHMWMLTDNDGEGTAWTYIFMEASDGTVYFGNGHDDILRWLYRMKRVDTMFETPVIPSVVSASIVSARGLSSDIEVKATDIRFDDHLVKITVSFENKNPEKEYYLKDASLDKYVGEGHYTVVSEYRDECAPIYLSHDISVSRDYIFERSFLESGQYMLTVFFDIDWIADNFPYAQIVFELENF